MDTYFITDFAYLCFSMAEEKEFTIEVSSSYKEFWRYNVALMCGCFDAADVRTNFASTEDTVADVGANLSAPPKGGALRRIVTLRTPPADHLLLYIYIIPHTLPTGRDVVYSKPFPLHLSILHGDRKIRSIDYDINQWSGASIELKVADAAVGISAD